MGGSYWYWHKNSNAKICKTVHKTAEQTQDLVTQSDENNEKRFEKLNQKNEERAIDIQTNVISEQRAGFDVLSQQLYTLTQITLQTLNSVIHNASYNDINGWLFGFHCLFVCVFLYFF